ncbi:MAG: hypothetical protein M3Z04_16720 [Chloroflexota bacterium]|nr:hypothetical protein [Chloroflexota bacterium]
MTHDKPTPAAPPRRLVDYYRFLGVPHDAATDQIVEAYLGKAQDPDLRVQERAEQALAALSDPATRAAYDRDLAANQAGSRPARTAQQATTVQVRPANGPADRSATTGPTTRPVRPPTPPATVINLDWRWALAAIPVLLLIGALLFGNSAAQSGSGGNTAAVSARTLAGAVAAPVVNGVQTLDVLVNGDTFQYEPKAIKVKKGLPVHLNLSVKGDPG